MRSEFNGTTQLPPPLAAAHGEERERRHGERERREEARRGERERRGGAVKREEEERGGMG